MIRLNGISETTLKRIEEDLGVECFAGVHYETELGLWYVCIKPFTAINYCDNSDYVIVKRGFTNVKIYKDEYLDIILT